MKNVSLRWRITLLSGAILLLCTVALTIMASQNAGRQFQTIVPPSTSAGTIIHSQQKPVIVEASPVLPVAEVQVTKAKKAFDTASIFACIAITTLGMCAVYFVVSKSLKPLSDFGKQVETITQYNLHERVEELSCAAEVKSLRHSFNAMLDRLDTSFQQQKQFSANVAHELKTPLATMSASVQVLHLEEHPSPQEYEKVLSTVERNTERLKEIVENLMQLCSEQPLTETEWFDLRELLSDVTAELEPMLLQRKVSVSNDCKSLLIRGHRSMLYQAFFNLIENAAKYNREGGSIRISFTIDGQVGTIQIEDTGIGIPESELSHIFEPFYRVNKSRSRKTGGSGLGLSVVKTILERHGWNISAESAVGVGTVFAISFYLD